MLALVVLVALATLRPASPAAAQSDVARIQREIYAVLPFDRDSFRLANAQRSAFAVYGDAGALVPVDCQRAATFPIISSANELGTIGVGVCHEHAARLRTLAPRARQGLDDVVASLKSGAPQWREDEVQKAGIFYQMTPLAGGGEQHYFAVLVIGHGVLVAPTVVLLRGDRAVIVQAATTHLCDGTSGPIKLCADTPGHLGEIARRVLAVFP